MKKICLIALAFFSLKAGAQYFQHTYGSSDFEALSSGVNTVVQGQGHFMSGNSRFICLPMAPLPVVFTDVDGNIPGAPYFAYNYILNTNNGEVVQVVNSFVFEVDNGSGFGVVGLYHAPTQAPPQNTGVFYLQLDPAGNAIQVFDYFIPNTSYAAAIGGICEAAGGNEIYVAGTAFLLSGTDTYPFALKIDVNTGNLLWNQVYDIDNYNFEGGQGICESPYAPEVVMVGHAQQNSQDGFFMRLDMNNGNVMAPVNIYGVAASTESFKSVRVANNTAAGAAGFIIGGDANTNMDAWVVNTDAAGNVNWASIFDNSLVAGGFNSCMDVIERFNTMGQWEYYAAGTSENGGGTLDAHVVKIDQMGNGVPMGEFTYGTTTNNERAHMLDMYSSGGTAPPDGLSVFSTVSGAGLSDFYLVKAYFNGVSGCNEKFNNPLQYSAPGLYNSEQVSQSPTFSQAHLKVLGRYTMSNSNICYNATIPAGDNSRVAPPVIEGRDKTETGTPNNLQKAK